MKSNSDNVTVPLHKYHRKLMQDIDEADWMGDYDHADFLRLYLKEAEEMINNGDTRYPLF